MVAGAVDVPGVLLLLAHCGFEQSDEAGEVSLSLSLGLSLSLALALALALALTLPTRRA